MPGATRDAVNVWVFRRLKKEANLTPDKEAIELVGAPSWQCLWGIQDNLLCPSHVLQWGETQLLILNFLPSLPILPCFFSHLSSSRLTNNTVHQSAAWHKENIKDILNLIGYEALSESHGFTLCEIVSYIQLWPNHFLLWSILIRKSRVHHHFTLSAILYSWELRYNSMSP